MRKFNITVNGKAYEVEVEEVGGVSMPSRPAAPVVTASAPKQTASAPAASAPAAPAPEKVIVAGGTTVNAPMPGTILDVRVAVGDTVKANDVLVILEAMKMENEIMSPVAGKVSLINVSKGTSVNSGDVIIVIE